MSESTGQGRKEAFTYSLCHGGECYDIEYTQCGESLFVLMNAFVYCVIFIHISGQRLIEKHYFHHSGSIVQSILFFSVAEMCEFNPSHFGNGITTLRDTLPKLHCISSNVLNGAVATTSAMHKTSVCDYCIQLASLNT